MRIARGSGHWLGIFLVLAIAIAVFVVSITLSVTFFQGITPPGKPWFPYFGLSLTEGGFLCWLGAFILVKHHNFHTAVEFVMCLLSFGGIVSTAGTELFSLMPGVNIDLHAPLFADVVGFLLTGVFLANIVSVFTAAIAFYTEANPGWFGGNANLIRMHPQNANLIRNVTPINEINVSDDMEEIEEGESPLGLPRPRPQEQEISLSAVGEVVKEGASTLIKRARRSMPRGKRAGRVPGSERMNMSGDMSDGGTQKASEQEPEGE